jgi:hypothetical protein
MADDELEAEGGFKQVGKDLFAGACGGIAQVLLGELLFSSIFELHTSRFARVPRLLSFPS